MALLDWIIDTTMISKAIDKNFGKVIDVVQDAEGNFFGVIRDLEQNVTSVIKDGVAVVRDFEEGVVETAQLGVLGVSKIARDGEEYLAIGGTDITRGVVSTVKDANRTWAAVADNVTDDVVKVVLTAQQNSFNLIFFMVGFTTVSTLGIFVLYKDEIERIIDRTITNTDSIMGKIITEVDFSKLPPLELKFLNLV